MRWDYNFRHGAAVPHPLPYMQVFFQIHLHQILHNQSLKGPTKTKVFYILIFLIRTQLSQTLGIFELMAAVIHRTPKHNCILHSLLHYLSNSQFFSLKLILIFVGSQKERCCAKISFFLVDEDFVAEIGMIRWRRQWTCWRNFIFLFKDQGWRELMWFDY